MRPLDLPPPVLVTSPSQLDRLAGELNRAPLVAVDTESNSLYAYQEQVCLLQFSTPKRDYLVDPLALEDLSPLAPFFASPRIEKIFHAAEYDVLCLNRDYGFGFAGIFDTMMAARVLGWKSIGLGPILEENYDIRPEKRLQRANWGQRPLPDHLLAYAQLDTHFLISLRNQMKESLEETGRWPLAAEDFERVCQVRNRVDRNENHSFWKINGAYDLTPRQAAVLKELCNYREEVARMVDRPVFKVINDHILLSIAISSPLDRKALEGVPKVSPRLARRYEKGILESVKRGMKAKPQKPPRAPRPDIAYLNRIDALRNWRKKKARKMGVNSEVILSRDLLQAIAQRGPRNLRELADEIQEVPYRMELFGEEILRVLKRI